MANIHDYLHCRGNLTMEESPFNEVDVLILAKLAYIPFDTISLHTEFEPRSIEEVACALLAKPGIEQHIQYKDDADLLRELAESKRFCKMQLSNFVNRVEEQNQTQFSAITIQLSESMNCISFRGTDNTLTGWKEDFNMSFLFPVPAQMSAQSYLENASANLVGSFVLCGHSKGGNLAMYAAAFCRETAQDRIIAVYNFDGPGFIEKALATRGYQRICSKITTFVPQSSTIGMLLEHEEQCIVVKNGQARHMQHDISFWELEGDRLCRLDKLTNTSRFFDRTLKRWLADMDAHEREEVVDALYSFLIETQGRPLLEFDETSFERTMAMLRSFKALDKDTRKHITAALTRLIRNAKPCLKEAS